MRNEKCGIKNEKLDVKKQITKNRKWKIIRNIKERKILRQQWLDA